MKGETSRVEPGEGKENQGKVRKPEECQDAYGEIAEPIEESEGGPEGPGTSQMEG